METTLSRKESWTLVSLARILHYSTFWLGTRHIVIPFIPEYYTIEELEDFFLNDILPLAWVGDTKDIDVEEVEMIERDVIEGRRRRKEGLTILEKAEVLSKTCFYNIVYGPWWKKNCIANWQIIKQEIITTRRLRLESKQEVCNQYYLQMTFYCLVNNIFFLATDRRINEYRFRRGYKKFRGKS